MRRREGPRAERRAAVPPAELPNILPTALSDASAELPSEGVAEGAPEAPSRARGPFRALVGMIRLNLVTFLFFKLLMLYSLGCGCC